MFKKIIEWLKSVFTKDNVKRFIHEAELSVVATASTTVNGSAAEPRLAYFLDLMPRSLSFMEMTRETPFSCWETP